MAYHLDELLLDIDFSLTFFFFFFFLHYNRKFHFDLYDLHLKRERKKISKHGNINMYFDLS